MNYLRKYAVASMLALVSTIGAGIAQAATLDEFLSDADGDWTITILDGTAAALGQCSAFTFGDVRGVCTYIDVEDADGNLVKDADGNQVKRLADGAFRDNTEPDIPVLAGGNGVFGGDRIAGTISITKTGRNIFVITNFQVDPYLDTAGSTFKTTMETDGYASAGGTVADDGAMTLDLTGRTGIARTFMISIGEQVWNIDNAALVDVTTDVYELLTTDTSSNIDIADQTVEHTLTRRALGDVDRGDGIGGSDGVLDAVLVSAGNVGADWLLFDGTAYTEAFNIRVHRAAEGPGPIVEKGTTKTECIQTPFGDGSNFTMLNPDGVTFGGTNDVQWEWDGLYNTVETDAVPPGAAHATIVSDGPTPFFGSVWTAHHLRVYEYTDSDPTRVLEFDTTCTLTQLENGDDCSSNSLAPGQTQRLMTMTLKPDQIGVHMLFDWKDFKNIDVVNVYDKRALWNNPDGSGKFNELYMGAAGRGPDGSLQWDYVSTDSNGDGANGTPMLKGDSAFPGYYANFNINPDGYCLPDNPRIEVGDTQVSSGCSLSTTPTKLTNHADWLLLLGFLVTLGLYRRKLQWNKT